jgi:hypothetical protein
MKAIAMAAVINTTAIRPGIKAGLGRDDEPEVRRLLG